MKISYFKVIIVYSLFITLIFNLHLIDYFEVNYHLKYANEFQEGYFLFTGYFLIFTTSASIFFLVGQRYLLKPLIIIFVLVSAGS